MSAQVRVQINDGSAFAARLKKVGRRKFEDRFQRIGNAICDRIEVTVESEFVTDRAPARRAHPGAHLHTSFYFKVDQGDSFPLRGRVLSRAPSVKVNSLNSGSAPHKITPSKKPGLLIPGVRLPGGSIDFGTTRWSAYARKKPRVKLASVNHPGNKRSDFIGRSKRYVIGQVRAGAIR